MTLRAEYRVRHGITMEEGLGYRALRSWNNGAARQWLGPWRAREADADADAARGSDEFRAVVALAGVIAVDRSTPDLGLWVPAPELAR